MEDAASIICPAVDSCSVQGCQWLATTLNPGGGGHNNNDDDDLFTSDYSLEASTVALVCNTSTIGSVPATCNGNTLERLVSCNVTLIADDLQPGQTTRAIAAILKLFEVRFFLAGKNWQPMSLRTVLQEASKLQGLAVRNAGFTTIQPWTTTPDLQALSLHGNQLTVLPAGFLQPFSRLKILLVLALGDYQRKLSMLIACTFHPPYIEIYPKISC